MDREELREKIAQWLFRRKNAFPNARFYHDWHNEIAASPLTEKEYLNLSNEILAIIDQYKEAKDER